MIDNKKSLSGWETLVQSVVYGALGPLVFRQCPDREGLELIALTLEGAICALCPPGLRASVHAEPRDYGFCVHVVVGSKGEDWKFNVQVLTELSSCVTLQGC